MGGGAMVAGNMGGAGKPPQFAKAQTK